MQQQGNVQSVQRAFALLEILAAKPDGLPIKELAETVSLPKSTVHRMLLNLIGLGYVSQNKSNGHYRATLKMFEVASGIVARMDIVSFARDELDKLSHDTGRAVHLVLPDGQDIVYVYKAEGNLASASMRMASHVGMRSPMYCTGVGKAIMAQLPYNEAARIWDNSKVRPLTPNTITSFNVLEKQLAQIKKRGWAVDDEENELGIRCVATALPTPGPTGGAMAAFSVTGLAPQMDDEQLQHIATKCLTVRDTILRNMGLQTGGVYSA